MFVRSLISQSDFSVYHGDIADEQSSQASPAPAAATEHAPEAAAAAQTAVDASGTYFNRKYPGLKNSMIP